MYGSYASSRAEPPDRSPRASSPRCHRGANRSRSTREICRSPTASRHCAWDRSICLQTTRCVTEMSLNDLDMFIEVLMALRGPYHRRYITEFLDSVFKRRLQPSKYQRPRGASSQCREFQRMTSRNRFLPGPFRCLRHADGHAAVRDCTRNRDLAMSSGFRALPNADLTRAVEELLLPQLAGALRQRLAGHCIRVTDLDRDLMVAPSTGHSRST